MANQMTGRIHKIYPTATITGKTGNTFRKRIIVLDCTRFDPYTGERGFENYPSFEFPEKYCDTLDNFKEGQVVTISFDIQGNMYNDKYLNTVRGYRIEERRPMQQSVPTATAATPTVISSEVQEAKAQASQMVDDLPF